MNVPVRDLNSSPAMWMEVPLPLDAMLNLPGLALAWRTKSAAVWMLSLVAFSAFITITLGTPATRVTGAKSFCGSKGILSYSDLLMPCVPTVPITRL